MPPADTPSVVGGYLDHERADSRRVGQRSSPLQGTRYKDAASTACAALTTTPRSGSDGLPGPRLGDAGSTSQPTPPPAQRPQTELQLTIFQYESLRWILPSVVRSNRSQPRTRTASPAVVVPVSSHVETACPSQTHVASSP